jgi:tryptophan synthase alpha chain
MNRIDLVFDKIKKQGEAAFIPFIVLGDPTAEQTLQIVRVIEPNFDLLEVGIPFSDPLADGPTIQEGYQRAFAAGMNSDRAFELISGIRKITQKPIIILTYFNVILNRRGNPATGIQDFLQDMDRTGVDGVIIADLPVEEAGDMWKSAQHLDKYLIFLVAPTTTPQRLQKIQQYAQGYLYVISRLGVTGARADLSEVTIATIKRVQAVKKIPLAVGFGISTPEHVKAIVKAGADGAIVGSAIVDLIKTHLENPAEMLRQVEIYAKKMKDATRRS